jgi:hypothetical protein
MKTILPALFLVCSTCFGEVSTRDLKDLKENSESFKSVTISPVLYENKNVFAAYEASFYSEGGFNIISKENADNICQFSGFKESTYFLIEYRLKPTKKESNELAVFGGNTHEDIFSSKAKYTHPHYEFELVEVFPHSEYCNGGGTCDAGGVVNSLAAIASAPFQLAYNAIKNKTRSKYGIFTSVTCVRD